MSSRPSAITRVEPPLSADEPTMLRSFLDYFRATLRRQVEGLDAAQLDATLPPASMTLGGMLKHLAYVEDWWCGVMLDGREPMPPFDAAPWHEDDDWEWHSAVDDGPDELRALLAEAIRRSDEVLDARPDLDAVGARPSRRTGEGVSVRWVLVHLIEEYARHTGHADLIRESIDGAVDL